MFSTSLLQMQHPIQMKPADSEKRSGKFRVSHCCYLRHRDKRALNLVGRKLLKETCWTADPVMSL